MLLTISKNQKIMEENDNNNSIKIICNELWAASYFNDELQSSSMKHPNSQKEYDEKHNSTVEELLKNNPDADARLLMMDCDLFENPPQNFSDIPLDHIWEFIPEDEEAETVIPVPYIPTPNN